MVSAILIYFSPGQENTLHAQKLFIHNILVISSLKYKIMHKYALQDRIMK